MAALFSTLSAILPDLLGILLGAIALELVGRRAGPSRTLDLAGYAWVPYLAVQVISALAFTAIGSAPAPPVKLAVDLAGVAWALGVWGAAVFVIREKTA